MKIEELIAIRKLNLIDIQITSRCNRSCKYCFGPQYNNIYLSYEVIKSIIDNMLIFKIDNISITGGEPFMHPNIDKILKYAKEKKLKVSFKMYP